MPSSCAALAFHTFCKWRGNYWAAQGLVRKKTSRLIARSSMSRTIHQVMWCKCCAGVCLMSCVQLISDTPSRILLGKEGGCVGTPGQQHLQSTELDVLCIYYEVHCRYAPLWGPTVLADWRGPGLAIVCTVLLGCVPRTALSRTICGVQMYKTNPDHHLRLHLDLHPLPSEPDLFFDFTSFDH